MAGSSGERVAVVIVRDVPYLSFSRLDLEKRSGISGARGARSLVQMRGSAAPADGTVGARGRERTTHTGRMAAARPRAARYAEQASFLTYGVVATKICPPRAKIGRASCRERE